MDSIVKMGVRQNRDGRPEEDSAAAAKAASRLSDERPCTGQAGSRRAGEFPPAGGRDEMKGTEAADTGADILDVNSALETSPGRKSVRLLDELLRP